MEYKVENKVTDKFLVGNAWGELRMTQRALEAAEKAVDTLRETKWALVKELKEMGYNFNNNKLLLT